MTRFQIIDAKPYHCGQIIRRMRDEHDAALACLGINSHREIRGQFDNSTFRRAALLDGRLAGLWGVGGSALSSEGFVWMVITKEAARYPVSVTREVRRQIDEIMVTKRVIHTNLIPEDRVALRFATKLGFEVSHPTPIPAGRGFVISVQYSRDQLSRAA